MDPEFWHARWQQRQIGFHQAEVHPLLQQFWPRLNLSRDSDVLVPCI
jgi:thiopurine S-methyltransferase